MSPWGGWKSLGKPSPGFQSAPAAFSRQERRCNVYVWGQDSKLWQRAYADGWWRAWECDVESAELRSTPAVGSMGDDHEHVFVVRSDGEVWQKWWLADRGWSKWESHGKPRGVDISSAPTTVSRSATECNIYVRGSDKKLWQKPFWNGAWGSWLRHDDSDLRSAPSATSMGPDDEFVFVKGPDGAVWFKEWTAETGVQPPKLRLYPYTPPSPYSTDPELAGWYRGALPGLGEAPFRGDKVTLSLPPTFTSCLVVLKPGYDESTIGSNGSGGVICPPPVAGWTPDLKYFKGDPSTSLAIRAFVYPNTRPLRELEYIDLDVTYPP